MSKHLDMIERIGISYWEGEIPKYLYSLISHNSEYFDRYYVLVSQNTFIVSPNSNVKVVRISREDVIKHTHLSIDNRIKDLLVSAGPALISDLVCLFPNSILEGCVKESYSRVLYFDLNSIIWNQFMINELFSTNHYLIWNNARRFMKEEGTYLSNGYKPYYSSDFSVCDICAGTDYFSEYLEGYLNRLKDKDFRYTVLGPSFLNNDNLWNPINRVASLPIEPNGLDPQLLHPGVIHAEHKTHSIGYTISNTLNEDAGYVIKDIKLIHNSNSCDIILDYKL